MNNFLNKVVVITGAASGIGRAMALQAGRRKMRLVIADIDISSLTELSSILINQDVEVIAVKCDVSQEVDVQHLADAAIARFENVHLLFNNAGIACGGYIWESSQADCRQIFDVNVIGVLNGIRVFMPLMLRNANESKDYEGYVVNTASMAGLVNAPLMGLYNASKHAVIALSETLHHDLTIVGAKISTSVLCPYFVPTRIAQSSITESMQRNNLRPFTASQHAAYSLASKATELGKIDADEVARLTFEAIEKKRFYIYSHPEALTSAGKRFDQLSKKMGPHNPYSDMPKVENFIYQNLPAD